MNNLKLCRHLQNPMKIFLKPVRFDTARVDQIIIKCRIIILSYNATIWKILSDNYLIIQNRCMIELSDNYRYRFNIKL